MRGSSLLVDLTVPNRFEVWDSLPEVLADGSRGGYRPFGMWDAIINPKTAEWCGVVCYPTEQEAFDFNTKNPNSSALLSRIVECPELSLDAQFAADCAKNGSFHLLRVYWAKVVGAEIFPVLDVSGWWYSRDSPSIESDPEVRFASNLHFTAFALMSFREKQEVLGLDWPRTLKGPVQYRNDGHKV